MGENTIPLGPESMSLLDLCDDVIDHVPCKCPTCRGRREILEDRLAMADTILARLPKDRHGNPLAPGMTVKLLGFDMSGECDYAGQTGTIVSVCNGHVWVQNPDDATDQTAFSFTDVEVVP